MSYAINLNTVLPLRKEAAETSEMVSQLLFGECCEVLYEKNSFVHIKNCRDNYSGWANKKMLTEITSADVALLQQQPLFLICVPVAESFSLSERTIYHLPAGSRLPDYNPETGTFEIGKKRFQVHPSLVSYLPEGSSHQEAVVPIALQFLNTPYLWGGKTLMGIDCSGLVQVVFSLSGIYLPRDAGQQAVMGIPVPFEQAIAGDLLFFEENNRIVHTGIYLGERRILHASGKVKISKVDNRGILSDDEDAYTHVLSETKRYFD